MYYLLQILLIPLVNYVNAEQCTTPNGEKAECTSLYGCPVLLKALATNQETASQFVRNSTCGGDAVNPMVCCGPMSTFSNNTIKQDKQQSTTKKQAKPLLPDRNICGFQHSDDFVHTENETVLTEFPWLAHIYVYLKSVNSLVRPNWDIDYCSGALINTRYVLAAASCIFSDTFAASRVTLGDFYLLNKTDCQYDGRYNECADDVQEAYVEEVIIHPLYKKKFDGYDIGLLRLNKSIKYSDYIRPICLREVSRIRTGSTLFTSGYNVTTFTKYRISNEVITAEECKKTFHWSAEEAEVRDIEESQFCILDKRNATDPQCNIGGFDGNPVMYAKRSQWFQEGIVTGIGDRCEIGPKICTNVTYHLNWIKESLKP